MASPRPSRSGRSLNIVQVTSLALAFILIAGAGGVLTSGLFLPFVGATGALVKSSVKMFEELPAELEAAPLSEISEIFWRDGESMAKIYAQDRIVVSLDQISPFLRDAVVATEDRRFYEHGGIDPKGMIRAAVSNVTGKDMQGASTLTQQYVKNSLLNLAGDDLVAVDEATDNSIGRKLREAKLAVSIEKTMPKDDILAGYLNIAQFGRSVYGAEAASLHYFGVHAADLTLDQAVLIAGITQNPTNLDPGVPENNADITKRRAYVVKSMVDTGKITAEQGEAVKAVPVADLVANIQPNINGCGAAGDAAFFCDYVVKLITKSEEFGKSSKERKKLLYAGGLKITTSLDKNMQAAATASTMHYVPADNQYGVAHGLVTVEPGTGEIRAMAQDRAYTTQPDIPGATNMNYNVDQAYGGGAGIQPGSTWKPFALAAHLKNGGSLSDPVDGTKRPYAYKDFKVGGCEYAESSDGYKKNPPGNSEGGDAGVMSVGTATAKSVNTAYVNLVSRYMTMCELRQTAVDLGMHDPTGKPFVVRPSTVLGGNEVAPLTMAAGYAAFAANGVYCSPVALSRVEDRNGKAIPVPSAGCKQAIPSGAASGVTSALVTALGSGTGRGKTLSNYTAAGKTGTTNSNRQVWFVGYTAQLATASWVTTPSNPSTALLRNLTLNGELWRGPLWGATLPLDSWRRYMNEAMTGMEPKAFGEAPTSMTQSEPIPPSTTAIPDVTGKPYRDAQTELEAAGFAVTVERNYVSGTTPKNTVAYTQPAAGTELEAGGAVSIFVSQG